MKTLKFDIMRDSPFKVLLGVVVPLLLVYGISVCILLRRRLFGIEPPPQNNA
ncbi:MAG: hypothetical protein IJO96_00415 [Oscillospiraceae bacterium]|nr:hypothetical protein [Oscillospiraceae bacterium]